MKTLLLALVGPGKTFGTREGAVRGLVGVGREAIRKGLIEGGGAKVIGNEFVHSTGGRESQALVQSVIVGSHLQSRPKVELIFVIGSISGSLPAFGHASEPRFR